METCFRHSEQLLDVPRLRRLWADFRELPRDFQQAMGLVWYYADSNPVMSRTGRRTLERLLADLTT